jgi:hypothetical protein
MTAIVTTRGDAPEDLAAPDLDFDLGLTPFLGPRRTLRATMRALFRRAT